MIKFFKSQYFEDKSVSKYSVFGLATVSQRDHEERDRVTHKYIYMLFSGFFGH